MMMGFWPPILGGCRSRIICAEWRNVAALKR